LLISSVSVVRQSNVGGGFSTTGFLLQIAIARKDCAELAEVNTPAGLIAQNRLSLGARRGRPGTAAGRV
jgi:hypothetical protein